MATNWGYTSQTGSFSLSTCRAMGGAFNPGSNQDLISVSAYIFIAGAGSLRIAVYQGGTDAGGPGASGSEATLVYDFGVITEGGADGFVTATHPGGPYPTLLDGVPVWIGIKSDGSPGAPSIGTATSDPGSDFYGSHGRHNSIGISTNEDTAWSSTWPTETQSYGNFWYSLYLTYETPTGGTTILVPTGPWR